MADQDTPYDEIIRAEIATEFINQARAIAMARIYELEAQDPDGARGPAPVRVELFDLHSSQ